MSISTALFSNPLRRFLLQLLNDPAYFWTLASLVVVGDAILSQLIIRFVSYTEIDWETYMVQTELYLKGERDYSLITGPTGPLVYPAGHVHIHRFLHSITNLGTDVPFAQQIYVALYISSLILTCAIYREARGVPNWTILLLPLSKRLHSVFMLRLFNDCWSVVLAQAAVFAYQKRLYYAGTFLYSAALSVKMSVLLYLPGLLVVLFKSRGLNPTLLHVITIAATQALFAYPFLLDHPWSYLKYAFDLSRVFMYKWTVNWRFVDEVTFLSPMWAKTLLIGHLSSVVAFGLWRWCRPDGSVLAVLKRGLRRPSLPAGLVTVTADYVATVLFTSNLIGILFARSLHYQFYSWYAHQLPFLAWRTRYHLVVKLAIVGSIEYAWNIFPSTPSSSGILLCANALLLMGVWFGHPDGKEAK